MFRIIKKLIALALCASLTVLCAIPSFAYTRTESNPQTVFFREATSPGSASTRIFFMADGFDFSCASETAFSAGADSQAVCTFLCAASFIFDYYESETGSRFGKAERVSFLSSAAGGYSAPVRFDFAMKTDDYIDDVNTYGFQVAYIEPDGCFRRLYY